MKLSGIFVAFNPPGTPANGSANSRTEQEARAKADDLEKKLKAGGEFATLARTESDNQQAASRGGELGTYGVGDPQLPASIRTAVQNLQAGQTSEPIRIPNAFLIVKLDSRNKQTFDQAKPEIQQKLKTEQSQAAVKQEVDKYKIQVQDPAFFNQTGYLERAYAFAGATRGCYDPAVRCCYDSPLISRRTRSPSSQR